MRILVLNAGSSSLKGSIVEDGSATVSATVEWGADASRRDGRDAGLLSLLEKLGISATDERPPVDAVGHRVVHGGEQYQHPVLVDDAVEGGIEQVSDLAPLHNGVALATLRAARKALPDVPHVACFDTAFHATLPEPAIRYPVPDAWRRDWGVRRFGFHGLSVAWAVGRAAELLERDPAQLRVVVAHLGSGCSVTAVQGGRSVDTSMGMTPLEGLMMGTRAGSLDPGMLLRLLRQRRLDVEELADVLDHRSGLFAVSGGRTDMRELTAAAEAGDAPARLAIEMFVRRAAAGIAATATALPLVDALVFTGGIGEHAASVRRAIVERLAGVGFGAIEDAGVDGDAVLSPSRVTPAILRIAAREDLVIAAEAAALLLEAGAAEA